MKNVTVDLGSPSFYAETDSKFYRFKRKMTYENILKRIRTFAKGKGNFSLLEIGTGSGFFMTFLESEFPKAELVGLEYDPRLVELTKTKVENAKIVQGNAEEFNFDNKKFDIIVSFQVIEHLYNPEAMLNSVEKHLKPDGIFIFTTPNLGSLGVKIMKDKWHGYREDHVSLKNCDDWQSITEKNGFSAIYIGSTFFSGFPILNKLPFGLLNWGLLSTLGSIKWKYGESFVGIFKLSNSK